MFPIVRDLTGWSESKFGNDITLTYSFHQETTAAETCIMGFLNMMTGVAVLDQYLLSYN